VAPQPNPIRVLLVDDDAMSRELLSVLLEAEGYAVESVDSGEAALAVVRQGAKVFGLVLTDLQMPGTTGPRLAGKLRRACGPATLLLAMSGSRPPDKTISSFDGFLLKPFKMQEIADLLSARTQPADMERIPPGKEKWTVVTGPARDAGPAPKLVRIHAPKPQPASKRGMNSIVHDAPPADPIVADKPPGGPVLNEKIYQQLAVSMPGKQLLEMYAMCVNDARKRIASMRGLAAAHDAAAFVREAHAIKGGCGMLGASELHSMAAELEKKGLEPANSPGSSDVNSLDELSAACDRLERILGSRA
jgi:CheY-like chemotaxis protein/HPt (histidine-containing phosphotransfer) domain-containing protein